VHGGGWKKFSKDRHKMVGRAFAKRGVATAVMSYRVSSLEWHTLLVMDAIITVALGSLGFVADAVPGSPAGWLVAAALGGSVLAALLAFQVWQRSQQEVFAKWPMHRDDVVLALSFLARAGAPDGELAGRFNPHNIFVMGHSAGAHMSLMTCFDSAELERIGFRVPPVSQAQVDEQWSVHGLLDTAPMGDERVPLTAMTTAERPVPHPSHSGHDTGDATLGADVASIRPELAIGTLRGVIAVSPPCISAIMTGALFTRHIYMRSVFGTDSAKWAPSFPDHLIAHQAAAGTCPKLPLLAITASPGWDLGLEVHVDRLEPVLNRAGVAYKRFTVTNSNHFSEMLLVDQPDSQSARLLAPAVMAWIRGFARAEPKASP
jgi:acetyl esterase/lipase